MHAHRAMIRTAYAAERRSVLRMCGSIDVDVLQCGVANDLHQFRRDGVCAVHVRLLGCCVSVGCGKCYACGTNAQQRETRNAHLEFVDESVTSSSHVLSFESLQLGPAGFQPEIERI